MVRHICTMRRTVPACYPFCAVEWWRGVWRVNRWFSRPPHTPILITYMYHGVPVVFQFQRYLPGFTPTTEEIEFAFGFPQFTLFRPFLFCMMTAHAGFPSVPIVMRKFFGYAPWEQQRELLALLCACLSPAKFLMLVRLVYIIHAKEGYHATC